MKETTQLDSSAAHGALNISEAAAYCGVRCSAIEESVRDGRLAGRRLGRNVIILKSDLDAFLSELAIIPAHTPPSILKRRQERLHGKDIARFRKVTPKPAVESSVVQERAR